MRIGFIFGILAALVLTITLVSNSSQQIVLVEGQVPPYTIEELVKDSDLVIIGRVDSISSPKLDYVEGTQIVYREVKIRILEILKGEYQETYIIIRILGGSVDSLKLIPPSAEPIFTKQEQVLLFIKQATISAYGSGQHYYVLGAFQGKYKIEDGLAINRDPRRSKSLDEIVREIKNTV